ncbi:poly-gamma-glutamate hydrolase family protein [Alicycliphilus denitrificans]|jgi:phage replication-related protein YjqB (UPF0714/DUF867 family)|uniref:poly-gamma-glutamate hydrolase family protein n=1 Tax=Alicycliphilus denitrificans TaxID=179636 RepID=UPI00384FC8AA
MGKRPICGGSLAIENINARLNGRKFAGTARANVCDQAKSKAGAQLELTRALRKSPNDVVLISTQK